jgi:WD40 repeat protein
MAQNTLRVSFKVDGYISQVTFSPDGRLLASGGDEIIRVWDVTGYSQRAAFDHRAPVSSLAFSPDSKVLASGGLGGVGSGWVCLWDVDLKRLAESAKTIANRQLSEDERRQFRIDDD